jgi:hypothetical protein
VILLYRSLHILHIDRSESGGLGCGATFEHMDVDEQHTDYCGAESGGRDV